MIVTLPRIFSILSAQAYIHTIHFPLISFRCFVWLGHAYLLLFPGQGKMWEEV